ncbi:MAG: MBOAT family protein, partial [Oscillospiraceae bacterium]|nr:MBOAT family protein [Oscillospiraceae bacterium]
VKKGRWIFNLLVVWALTGFWHGAQWNFILWGLYYAALLLIEKLLLGKWLEKLPSVLRWVYTFFFVNLGWVLFDRTDFASLKSAVQTLFVYRPTDWAGVFSSDLSLLVSCLAVIPALALSFPILRRPLEKLPRTLGGTIVLDGICVILLALCIASLISTQYNPFIYFRF